MDQGGGLDGDRVLFVDQLGGFQLKAGLVGPGIARYLGPAMDALDEPGLLKRLDVAPNSHG
ncbi:hypothetical protein AHiyo1_39950 [Arthrobacter sp. Hiyo1]|nr:hypothetical protein AHiyo1_39950 [Arthrobacter sp. Hiyo1]